MAIKLEDVSITGDLSIGSTNISAQERLSILRQDANAIFPVNFALLRVHDAFATNLPGTAASDDLGLSSGTFGTSPMVITGGDMKALGATTRYARFQVELPECYDSAETVSISMEAGMVTTVADASCTIDLQCYKLDKAAGIGSDLCVTAAMTMNSLVFSTKTFAITSSGFEPGDVLDVRIAITCTDAATATAVIPTIGAIDLLCDIKG